MIYVWDLLRDALTGVCGMQKSFGNMEDTRWCVSELANVSTMQVAVGPATPLVTHPVSCSVSDLAVVVFAA